MAIWKVLEFAELLTTVKVAVVFSGPADRPGNPFL
jgi:hypothetical protein